MKIRKLTREQEGSALVVVLVFITIFGLWVSASLMAVQVTAKGVSKRQTAIENKSDANRAIAELLGTIATSNQTLGVAEQANCGFENTSVYQDLSSRGIRVECFPTLDSGAFNALDAIILTGTGSNIGVNGGLSVGGSSSLVIGGSITNFGNFKTTGNSSVQVSKTAYVKNQSDCLGISANHCSVGSHRELALKSRGSGYYKALLSGVMSPNNPKLITELNFPDCNDNSNSLSSPSPKSNWMNGYVLLEPGIYDWTAIRALNNLTAQNLFYGPGPASNSQQGSSTGRKSCPANNKGTIEIRLLPGVYNFNDNGSVNSLPWNLSNSTIAVKSYANNGNNILNEFGVCTYPSSIGKLDSELISNPDGVQLIFSNSASLVLSKGSVELCPISFKTKPQISIAALSPIDVNSIPTVLRYPAWSGTSNLLSASGAQATLKILGQIFIPDASLYVNSTSAGTITFGGGIVALAMSADMSTSAKSPLKVQEPRIFNNDRVIKIVISKNSKIISTTTYRIKDNYGQNPAGSFQRVSN